MNIQIFGKSKCFDTKKAERYFKERGIRVQSVDLPRYGLSAGEFASVCRAVGGWAALLDEKHPDAALVRWGDADGCVLQSLFSPYKQQPATTFDQRTQPPGACTQREGFGPIPTHNPAHAPTIANGQARANNRRGRRPQGCSLTWEEVSFFRRPFSETQQGHQPLYTRIKLRPGRTFIDI